MIKYNEPSTGDDELQTRIDASNCKFYESGKNLMNYKIALETRVKIFNSLVRSRLTYACQTWSLTQRQQNHMNATYGSMLRWLEVVTDVSKGHTITNILIRAFYFDVKLNACMLLLVEYTKLYGSCSQNGRHQNC